MKIGQKLLSLGGMLMIGDGLSYVLGPRQHVEAWRGKARGSGYNRMLGWFVRHKILGGGIALGEVIAGAAIIRRAEGT